MKHQNIKFEIGDGYPRLKILKHLEDFAYNKSEKITCPGQYLSRGENIIIYPVNCKNSIRIVFFGNIIESISEIDKNYITTKKLTTITIDSNILSLADGSKIKRGDYIVHEDHGIGLFSNLEIKKVSNKLIKYIVIEYKNLAKLFLPFDQQNKLSPYIGVGRKKPLLSRLGSASWKKTYQKTYENIILFARELLSIYAKREITRRHSYKIFSDWEKEIKKTFGYIETADQVEAISEIYKGLEDPHPFDRLICGDVGFGKTEVAIRAMTQVCANGYQVAFLVPTTILTEQHYATLKNRFAKLPVIIGHLSRLVDTKNQHKIIAEIEEGKIDIVVGTHKILSTNIKFKKLGLLVIDEEQRFGVKQKEVLKKLKNSIDILSLTATPIPRTLFMALSGIRDISNINIPPQGRREIKTEIGVYKEARIQIYIDREIKRGGQIYFLHNNVSTILGTKNKLQKLYPTLKIAIAHGQMNEIELARTMSQFAAGEIQILVCSTIIENGLDISNVNTIIVEECDRFGLSQLYQIRGRIGRSRRQAYGLFTFKDKQITKNAYKRLNSLLDNTELGSGYNIALSDLEIRGGGNILGREQHGNMEAIGLVLYTKMLKIAIKNLNKI